MKEEKRRLPSADIIDSSLLVLKTRITIKHVEYVMRHCSEDEIKNTLITKMYYLGIEYGNCINPFDPILQVKPAQHKYSEELLDSFELGAMSYAHSAERKVISH